MRKTFALRIAILLGLSPASITVLIAGLRGPTPSLIFVGSVGIVALILLGFIAYNDVAELHHLRSVNKTLSEERANLVRLLVVKHDVSDEDLAEFRAIVLRIEDGYIEENNAPVDPARPIQAAPASDLPDDGRHGD